MKAFLKIFILIVLFFLLVFFLNSYERIELLPVILSGNMIYLIIITLIIVFILSIFFKKGNGLQTSGNVLVIRRFHIDEFSEDLKVEIVGRISGIAAWLLTSLGIDAETKLLVHKTKIVFKSNSLSGEFNQVVPMSNISSTHCGYSKPIFLLFFSIILFIAELIAIIIEIDFNLLLVGLIIIGLFLLMYFLSKRILIVIETYGGMQLSLSFKRSVIENVAIDMEQALIVIKIINETIINQQTK
jgi:hypothetical protein